MNLKLTPSASKATGFSSHWSGSHAPTPATNSSKKDLSAFRFSVLLEFPAAASSARGDRNWFQNCTCCQFLTRSPRLRGRKSWNMDFTSLAVNSQSFCLRCMEHQHSVTVSSPRAGSSACSKTPRYETCSYLTHQVHWWHLTWQGPLGGCHESSSLTHNIPPVFTMAHRGGSAALHGTTANERPPRSLIPRAGILIYTLLV